MKNFSRALGALLFAALLAACGTAKPAGDAAIVAQVGTGSITAGDFKRSLQPGANAKDVLDQLIDVELVVQAARREGVGADPKKVEEQITQLKGQQGAGTDEGLQTFLKQQGIESVDRLREVLVRQQLIDTMILNHSTLEQAKARHILLAADGPDKQAALKPEAEALLKQLEDGGDFEALAKEKSEDPGSATNGGDLGWQPKGVFVPEFDEAMFSMKKGELRLVASQFGWHIIRLDEEPQAKALENREALNSPAGQQAFEKSFIPWVKQLRTDADTAKLVTIVIDPATLVPTAAPVPEGQPAPDGQPAPGGQPAPEGQPAPAAPEGQPAPTAAP